MNLLFVFRWLCVFYIKTSFAYIHFYASHICVDTRVVQKYVAKIYFLTFFIHVPFWRLTVNQVWFFNWKSLIKYRTMVVWSYLNRSWHSNELSRCLYHLWNTLIMSIHLRLSKRFVNRGHVEFSRSSDVV